MTSYKKIIFILPFILTSCLSSSDPIEKYTLNPIDYPAQKHNSYELKISKPKALYGLDTTHILLKEGQQKINFYACCRWIQPLPVLVHNTLKESFKNSHLFSSISSGKIRKKTATLRTEIIDFHASYKGSNRAPLIQIKLNVELIKGKNTYHHSPMITIQVPTNTRADIMRSFDLAYQDIQKQIIHWAYNYLL